jgi:hypothetical protein
MEKVKISGFSKLPVKLKRNAVAGAEPGGKG